MSGEPELNNGADVVYFLETAALERASNTRVALAPTNKEVARIWSEFLSGALSVLDGKIVDSCPPTKSVRLRDQGWARYGEAWGRLASWEPDRGETSEFIPNFDKIGEPYRHRLWDLHPSLFREYRESLRAADGRAATPTGGQAGPSSSAGA